MIHSPPTFGRWLNVGSQRDIQVVVEAARSGCCSSRCHALTFEHECDPHQPSREGAPRASLRALADADAIVKWRVPDGMTSHVYAFEGRGGTFRISLTYDALTGVGKTNRSHGYIYGHLLELVPNERGSSKWSSSKRRIPRWATR